MITSIGLEKFCFLITEGKNKHLVFIFSVSSLLASNSIQCVNVVILETEIFG